MTTPLGILVFFMALLSVFPTSLRTETIGAEDLSVIFMYVSREFGDFASTGCSGTMVIIGPFLCM